MSTLNSVEMTEDEFRQKAVELNRLENENWKKHFETHPEQLLLGAEVHRLIPMEEVDLWARLSLSYPSGPDDGSID